MEREIKVHAKKLLFLDIDGVLLTNNWWEQDKRKKLAKEIFKKKHVCDKPLCFCAVTSEFVNEAAVQCFDSECMRRLQFFIQSQNCAIVLSSSWRTGMTLLQLKELFQFWPFLSQNLIGKTGSLDLGRGPEIQDYLDATHADVYIIVDDVKPRNMSVEMTKRWVKCELDMLSERVLKQMYTLLPDTEPNPKRLCHDTYQESSITQVSRNASSIAEYIVNKARKDVALLQLKRRQQESLDEAEYDDFEADTKEQEAYEEEPEQIPEFVENQYGKCLDCELECNQHSQLCSSCMRNMFTHRFVATPESVTTHDSVATS
jgi:Swiss Army Knife RNA repair-like protein